MKPKSKRDLLFDELRELFRKAPEAMDCIAAATGKLGYSRVNPLNEKRWGKRCWEAYHVLTGIAVIIQHGITPAEADEQFIKGWKLDSPMLGKHVTEPWPQGGDQCIVDVVKTKPRRIKHLNGAKP